MGSNRSRADLNFCIECLTLHTIWVNVLTWFITVHSFYKETEWNYIINQKSSKFKCIDSLSESRKEVNIHFQVE